MNTTAQNPQSSNPQVKITFKLGLDTDLKQITVTIQADHQMPKPAQSFTVARLLEWIKRQVDAGHEVYTVYESCGFGYSLHYQLVQAGAHSLVISPVRLDTQRRRKNDRLDSRQLCLRLSRYLDGQKDELSVIRVPSVAEQQRRELGRQRKFWNKQVRQLENHGRALRLEHEFKTLPAGWAGPRKWKGLLPELSEFLHKHLEPVKKQIVSAKAQVAQLDQQIKALVSEQRLPKGLGRLTLSLADAEVCDWGRFKHRKAPSSYTGCCPSEHSSGPNVRQGSIDRHGNRHLRVLLVEAVWRLLRFQPLWHARRKFIKRMKAGQSLRKKTVVALARQLAVDLWRWRTGRASLADLGLVVPASA